MAGHSELTKDVDIDIGALFSNIWKKKLLIVVISALAGALIFLVMSSIDPRYRTTAQIIIEPRESQFTRVQQNGGINASDFDAAAVLSQVQIIQSDDIALSTIKRLKLADREEFRESSDTSMLSNLLIMAGLSNDPLDVSPEERVLNAFKDRLKAYSIDQSRVIEILFWANDRKLAKEITNSIADEYLKLQRRSKLETDADATKFLEPEIAALRKKVRDAEAKVAEFRSSSDILIGNNNALLATQQLSEISTELSRVRALRSAAQAKVESVRSTLSTGASLEAIPEVVASPLIQRLRERQVQLRAQISELSTTLLSSHPRLKALKSQVNDFENQIRKEARGILRSLENDVTISQKQEKSMVQELSRLKAESSRAGEAEVELRALEREAVSERELLQAYMTKFREAAGRQSSKYLPINARIISAAHLPTQSYFPKTIPYTIAGTIVTAILCMVSILTLSLLSGKAFSSVGNSGRTIVPPRDSSDNESEFSNRQPEKFAENTIQQIPPSPIAMSDVPSQQDSKHGDNISVTLAAEGLLNIGKSRIAVVSPGGDQGSLATGLLARSLANSGKTVAVMDMTGSGITSHHLLGELHLKGIRDLLAGNADFDEIIHSDRISSVTVLPVGVSEPQEVNNAIERLNVLVDALSKSYDYLIIDCGITDEQGIAKIANAHTVVLVSAIENDNSAQVEAHLLALGYADTIKISPSAQELTTLSNMAA